MGIKEKNKQEKYKKILQIKLNSEVNVLCDKLPKEFIEFVNYIKELGFEHRPNYQYLKTILGNIYNKYNFNYDSIYNFTDYLTKKEIDENENKNSINLNPFSINNKEKIEETKIIESNKQKKQENDIINKVIKTNIK